LSVLLVSALFRRYRPYRTHLILGLFALLILEPWYHVNTAYSFRRPSEPLDPPFHRTCVEPQYEVANTRRQNAALFMLARNSDLDGAIHAVRSLEHQFNRFFGYPWVFINDQEWSQEFKKNMTGEIQSGGTVTFDTISEDMWTWPEAFSEREKDRARKVWKGMYDAMEETFQNGTHVKKDSYHHMCRFNSGFFYDHPALEKYRWYWRVEPDVEFTCAIPYDPFTAMADSNKVYGYTVALWEVGSLIPTLYRAASDWAYKYHASKAAKSPLWNAMVEPSWAPWPIRKYLLSHFSNRNAYGDSWSLCHFWSNFEIADLDFFRSNEYRKFFTYLDDLGGIYHERWGDAPIHSLAAALFLKPEQVHYFQDIGYGHPPFQHCPIDEGVGCHCNCDKKGHVEQYCLERLRQTVEP